MSGHEPSELDRRLAAIVDWSWALDPDKWRNVAEYVSAVRAFASSGASELERMRALLSGASSLAAIDRFDLTLDLSEAAREIALINGENLDLAAYIAARAALMHGIALVNGGSESVVAGIDLVGLALARSLEASDFETAHDVVDTLHELAGQATGDLAMHLCAAVADRTLEAQVRLPPESRALFQEAFDRMVVKNFSQREANAAYLFCFLQLARGNQYATALAYGSTELLKLQTDRSLEELLDSEPEVAPEPIHLGDVERELLLTKEFPSNDDCGEPTDGTGYRVRVERAINDHLTRRADLAKGLPFPQSMIIEPQVASTAIDDRTVLLALHCGKDPNGRPILSLGAFAKGQSTHGTVRLPDRFQGFADLVQAARAAIVADPRTKGLFKTKHHAIVPGGDELLTRLEGELFGGIRGMLDAQRALGRDHLLIVPDGPFHYFPFHLLGGSNAPLADKWKVTYLPNLRLLRLRELQTASPFPRRDCVDAFGIDFLDPPQPGHQPLPEAVVEAEAIANIFGGDAITNRDANRDRVWLALRSARFVHFASHGSLDVEAPAFQSISLNTEFARSEIRALDMLYLDLRGLRLVTLGACETAMGRFDPHGNVRGMTANLLLAGAQAVVGTLWPIETSASLTFFTSFYEALRNGRLRLDAFADAQTATRSGHPEFRDWGAFHYVGEWGEYPPEPEAATIPGIPYLKMRNRAKR